jgi:hypothetical protein
LFGYDFEMDHKNLTQGENPRADVEVPAESLMLEKPTLTIPHKGGKRMGVGSWEYKVLERWIAGGAKGLPKNNATLKAKRLRSAPSLSGRTERARTSLNSADIKPTTSRSPRSIHAASSRWENGAIRTSSSSTTTALFPFR